MKRNYPKILALTASLALVFSACGNAPAAAGPAAENAAPASADPAAVERTMPTPAPVTETPAAESETPATTESPAPTSTPEPFYNGAYRPILEKVYTGIAAGIDMDADMTGLTGVMEMANYLTPREALATIGYTVADFSGDGKPELLVGCIADEASGTGSLVFALYTCPEEQPELVFEGWGRSRYEWMGGPRFFYSGSSGAAYSLFGACHLSTDGRSQVWDEFYYSTVTDPDANEIGYFRNTTGEFEGEGSEPVEQEAFSAAWDRLFDEVKEYELTPFTDYVPLSPVRLAPVRAVSELQLPGGQAGEIAFSTGSSEFALRLAFVPEETLKNVELLSLEMKDVSQDGKPTWAAKTLYSQPELTPEKPLAVELTFPGDLPAFALRCTDASGAVRCFVLSQSGFDGSLMLTEYDLDAFV